MLHFGCSFGLKVSNQQNKQKFPKHSRTYVQFISYHYFMIFWSINDVLKCFLVVSDRFDAVYQSKVNLWKSSKSSVFAPVCISCSCSNKCSKYNISHNFQNILHMTILKEFICKIACPFSFDFGNFWNKMNTKFNKNFIYTYNNLTYRVLFKVICENQFI